MNGLPINTTQRVHIYELPKELNDGYCFGVGGNPITFTNVDFFDVPPEITLGSVIKFVKAKSYFTPGKKYLMLGETFAVVIV